MARVEGARQLRRTLKKAGADLKELKAVNRAAAEVVLPVARANSPVRTGALAKSVRVGATQSAGIIRAGNKRKSASGVPYAGVIHYGNPHRQTKAQPFVLLAARSTEPVWVAVYLTEIQDAVRRIEGK